MDVSDVLARGESMGIRPRRQAAKGGSHGREWRDVPARDLAIGDTIMGSGVIHTIARNGSRVGVVAGVSKNLIPFQEGEMVRAFVKK